MLGTILVVLLVLFLVGALPTWNHSRSWGLLPQRRDGFAPGDCGYFALTRSDLVKSYSTFINLLPAVQGGLL